MTTSISIAILGNITTEYLANAIEDACNNYDITASIYNSQYNQYSQDIINKSSGYYKSNPDLTILHLEGRILFPELYCFETLENSLDKKENQVNLIYNSIIEMLESIHSNCNTKIILNNFKVPYHSPLGILDNKNPLGLKKMISIINSKLEDHSKDKDYLYVFDYNGLCSQFGLSNSEDSRMYYINKNIMSFPFLNLLSKEYLRYLLPLKSKNKKCLVLDLDNTLWGGIAGEDGLNGIELDISGICRCFYDFQREILNLYHKGILLAINSKNNISDALEIIEKHPYMLLRKEYFSSIKINWQDKATNLKEIANDLNIGIDSLIFFDDNVVERELIKSLIPQVTVIDVPIDKSKYIDALRNIVEFEVVNLTQEDTKRNAMYEVNKKRQEFKTHFDSIKDYLENLDMTVTIELANNFTIPRISQLTQKTNQFNMTNKRYSDTEITEMINSGKYLIFSCKVCDKFGDNGLAGVSIVRLEGVNSYIENFLLSCRVLGRNIEYSFLYNIVKILLSKDISTIYSNFIKSNKNFSNENFYADAGFSLISESDIEKSYILQNDFNLKDYSYIKVIIMEEVLDA